MCNKLYNFAHQLTQQIYANHSGVAHFFCTQFPGNVSRPLRARRRINRNGHNCGHAVRKKARFTHERSNFCGAVSGKHFKAHGAEGKTQNEVERATDLGEAQEDELRNFLWLLR